MGGCDGSVVAAVGWAAAGLAWAGDWGADTEIIEKVVFDSKSPENHLKSLRNRFLQVFYYFL